MCKEELPLSWSWSAGFQNITIVPDNAAGQSSLWLKKLRRTKSEERWLSSGKLSTSATRTIERRQQNASWDPIRPPQQPQRTESQASPPSPLPAKFLDHTAPPQLPKRRHSQNKQEDKIEPPKPPQRRVSFTEKNKGVFAAIAAKEVRDKEEGDAELPATQTNSKRSCFLSEGTPLPVKLSAQTA